MPLAPKPPWLRPLLFGHRGAPATGLPENTFASFARALADGAGALETDVHCTKDGHVVVSHDTVVRAPASSPPSPPLAIASSTLAELRAVDLGGGERVPLLREVLDRFAGIPVNVDVKQRAPSIERAVIDAVAGDAERVLLASFHADVLGRVRALGYAGPTGLSKREVARVVVTPGPLVRVLEAIGAVRGVRAQVPRQSGRIRFDTRAFIDKCHAIGVAVDFWVVNDVDEARELLALGADGIMSDAPAMVRAAFVRSAG